jgi:hypothetical protein
MRTTTTSVSNGKTSALPAESAITHNSLESPQTDTNFSCNPSWCTMALVGLEDSVVVDSK